MMRHSAVPCSPPENRDIATMTAEELRQLFTWCDFKDSIGHLLTMNADFQALVARATAKRS